MENIKSSCIRICQEALRVKDSTFPYTLSKQNRAVLNHVVQRIRAIRHLFNSRGYIRASIALFKFEEKVHDLAWVLNINDTKIKAYDLEKYILEDTIYNDLRVAIDNDYRFGETTMRSEIDEAILSVLKNHTEPQATPGSINHIKNAVIPFDPALEIETYSDDKVYHDIYALYCIVPECLTYIEDNID